MKVQKSVTCCGVLDIDDKLDRSFDLFPKSLSQQNQRKSMVIVKAKCKGKSLPLLDKRAALYIHDHVSIVPIYAGTHW